MRRLLAALLLSGSALAQDAMNVGPCRMDGADCQSYAAIPAPSACADGYVPYFAGTPPVMTCMPTVWAASTLTVPGTVAAKNITASGLATPGAITVTPTLSKVATITTVAGAALVDGDYFTIKYDTGLTVPIEFDAAPGDGTTGGRVPLVFAPGDTADAIRDAIIVILNTAAPTKITASSGGAATVAIVLDTPGAAGDTNTENVANGGFAVTGFANPTAATTYTYKLVARLSDGSTTEAGAASSTAAGYATLSAANYNALSWAAVTGAVSYDVYRTVGGATQGKIAAATTALALSDTGLAAGGETAPTVDSTGLLRGDGLRIGTSATPGNVLTADANGYYTPQAGGGISGLTTGTIPKATSATAIGNSNLSDSGTAVTSAVPVLVPAGAAAATAKVGGVLNVNTTAQATTGTSEEILATYTLPANALDANGKAIRISGVVTTAANANNKVTRIKFGGIGGATVASRSSTDNGMQLAFSVVIVRTAVDAQYWWGSVYVSGASGAASATLTSNVDIVVTGQTATAAGDLTFRALMVEVLN